MSLSLPQKILGGIGALLLLGLTWTGVSGFFNQLSDAEGTGQLVQTYSEIVYGAGAFFSLVTTTWGRRWATIANVLFIVGIAFAGGLAPVSWGGAPPVTGLMTGAASLAIAVGVLWMLRRGFPSQRDR